MTAPDDAIRAVRDIIDNAQEWRPPGAPPPTGDDPKPNPTGGLPPDCPVIPLGLEGNRYSYLDALGQLQTLAADKHGQQQIHALFGPTGALAYLWDHWPRRTENKATGEWVTTGWKPELAGAALREACANRGIWNAFERVRGNGAWLGPEGELVLHLGQDLLVVPAEKPAKGKLPWRVTKPGLVGELVYPFAPAMARPADKWEPDGSRGGVGQIILDLFGTWVLRRPEIDPTLMLGWVAAAMLSGAVTWRPVMWVTGGSGCGKSTYMDLIKWLLGPNGILKTSDPTPAGIRQILKYSAIPVGVDEAEADEDGRRMNALVTLARNAATGSLSVRGGSDHEAATFTVRAAFLFASILVPSLPAQDRNRIMIVELGRIPPGAERPRITQKSAEALGRRLLRRLVQGWWRWQQTVDLYRDMLAAAGHSARGQDVIGTLLAAADLALYDDVPDSDTLDAWREKLLASVLAETAGADDDAQGALKHLLTCQLENSNTKVRRTVGDWLMVAAGRRRAKGEELPTPDQVDGANRLLSQWGCKLVMADIGNGKQPFFAVAHRHTYLGKLFAHTQWQARPGADGVWKQSLNRLCDTARAQSHPVFFGATVRSTLIPIDLCLPEGDPE